MITKHDFILRGSYFCDKCSFVKRILVKGANTDNEHIPQDSGVARGAMGAVRPGRQAP